MLMLIYVLQYVHIKEYIVLQHVLGLDYLFFEIIQICLPFVQLMYLKMHNLFNLHLKKILLKEQKIKKIGHKMAKKCAI